MECSKWQIESKAQLMRLPEPERTSVISNLRKKVISRKLEELKSSERVNQALTKDLYWKFDSFSRETNYQRACKWGVWLKKHREQSDEKLSRFCSDTSARQRRVAALKARKASFAPMNELEDAIMGAAGQLPTSKSVELLKSFASLRKSKSNRADDDWGNKNRSSNRNSSSSSSALLVRRDEFDRHLQDVLAPMWKDALPLEVKTLAEEARKSHEQILRSAAASASVSSTPLPPDLFYPDKHAAAARVIEIENQKSAISKKNFDEWKREKLELLQNELNAKV